MQQGECAEERKGYSYLALTTRKSRLVAEITLFNRISAVKTTLALLAYDLHT